MNKILIFRTDRIGDFLISTPIFSSLKRKFINCKIDIVCSNLNYEYVKSFNFFNKVLLYPDNFYKKLSLGSSIKENLIQKAMNLSGRRKVILTGGNKARFDWPYCRGYFSKYYVCMKQKGYDYDSDKEVDDKLEVGIINIEDFPKVKEIIDELRSFNLNYYKITVYGEMMQQGFEPKIDADFIKLEKVLLDDDAYMDALNSGIYDTLHDKFAKYYKEKFPDEKKVPRHDLTVYNKP